MCLAVGIQLELLIFALEEKKTEFFCWKPLLSIIGRYENKWRSWQFLSEMCPYRHCTTLVINWHLAFTFKVSGARLAREATSRMSGTHDLTLVMSRWVVKLLDFSSVITLIWICFKTPSVAGAADESEKSEEELFTGKLGVYMSEANVRLSCSNSLLLI